MKRLCTWIILLCFATQSLAVEFQALDNSEVGKYFVANRQAAAYTVPKGTRGHVEFIKELPAKNNRTGETDHYIGIKIEQVGKVPGLKTGLKPGMVILVYYSAEKSQRVMKLTDDQGHAVKDITLAKYGLMTKNFTNRHPDTLAANKAKSEPQTVVVDLEPKTKAKAAPPACPVGGLDGKNAKNMQHALNCLSQNTQEVQPPTPKQNDPIVGEILTYINNFVWNDIQHERRFDSHHIKDPEKRKAARLAEYKRREKINEITAPALVENARKHNLDEALLVGIAQTESSFDAERCSKAGACGLFQLMLGTAKQYSGNKKLTKNDLKNGRTNSAIAALFLRDLENKFNGDIKKMLYVYNDGEKNIKDIEAGKKKMPKETAEYPTKVLNATMQIKSAIAEAQKHTQKLASNQ